MARDHHFCDPLSKRLPQAYHKNQAIILVTVLSTECFQIQRKLAFAVIESVIDLMSPLVGSDL